jgi:hypothetical protein
LAIFERHRSAFRAAQVCGRTRWIRFFLGRSLWFSVSWLSEESEPTEQSVRCADQAFGDFDSVLSFLSRGGVGGQTRIFQLVPSAPQVSEWPEAAPPRPRLSAI